jgi:hypothetical protein
MRKPSRLRNRLYGRVPPHRLDAVVHRSLLVLGAMAWLAAAPVLANLLGINWWRALLLPLWVAFLLPSTLLLLEAMLRRFRLGAAAGLLRTAFILPALPLWFLGEVGNQAAFLGLTLYLPLAVIHGLLLPHPRSDGKAVLAGVLPILLATLVLASAAAPPWTSWLAMPILPGSLACLLLVQARSHDRQRWARPLILQEASGSRFDLSGRVAFGLVAGGLLLLLLLVQPDKWFPEAPTGDVVVVEGEGEEQAAGRTQSLPPLEDPTSSNAPSTPVAVMLPVEVRFDGELIEGSARAWRTLFQVRSSLDQRGPFFGRERPLYLRSQTYDRIEATGLRASPEPIDVFYGEPSGAGSWSWMVLDEQADLDRAVEFTLVGYPLRRPTGRGDLAILLHRAPVAAVQVEELHRFPSGPLLTTAATDEPIRYRWMNELEAATAGTLDGPWRGEELPRPLTAAQADPRYLQLPEGPDLLPWLDEVRRTGETDPRARIAEVLRRYEPYRYSRVVGAERGLDSLLAFRERRQGYCTYFATAVALELRSLGIPCRLVGGFRVTRWSPTAQAYLGSAQEAHLWVEVPTAEQGWVALEATPGEELDELLDMDLAASAAAAEREKARIAAEAEEDGLKNEETPLDAEWINPTLRDLALDELSEEGGPTAGEWTLKHWLIGLAALLLFPLLFPLLRSFQRGSLDIFHRLPEEEAEGGMRSVRMPSTWGQVLERLDQLGYRRQHSQTTSEFAREVAMERRVDAHTLLTAVRRKERFRFGDRDWKPSDEEAAQALLAALDRLDEKADGGPEAA